MRTGLWRERFINFLLAALLLAVPLAAWGFGTDLMETGVLGIFFSILAMVWNVVYNHYFDILLLKNGRNPARRGFLLRAAHALLFEAGFIIVSVPAIAWWLSLSLVKALAMDLGLPACRKQPCSLISSRRQLQRNWPS